MLTGREEEQRIIGDLLARCRTGVGGGLLVLGQPGIGKSALLDEAASGGADMRILRATGIEAEAGLPYAGLHLLLRPVIKRMAGLPAPQRAALGAAFGLTTPTAHGSPEPADRLLFGLAVLTLLAELAEDDGPLLCLVDDAHWLDRPSLEALVFAARRLEDESVAMLFGARDGHDLLDSCTLARLQPAGLSEAEAGALLDRRDDALSGPDRARILAQAHGNPLAILELPLLPTPSNLDGTGLLLETVHIAWYLGDREVADIADLFMTIPLAQDDPLFTVALYIESALLLTLHRPLGFEPIQLAEAMDRAAAADYSGPQAQIMLSTVAPILAQESQSHAVLAAMAADCRTHGRLAWLSPALSGLARTQVHLGRLREAQESAAEAHALAEAAGQTQWLSQVNGVLAYLTAVRGEEESCRQYAQEALTDLSPTVMSLGASWGWWALGLLELGLGRPAEALEHFHALSRGPSVHQIAAARCLPDLLEAAVRAGERELAEETLARICQWAAEVRQDCADALVLRGRALLADDGAAHGHYAAALDLYADEDRPFDRARTQLLWGEWLRRERHRTEARLPLRHALATFEQLGVLSRGELPALLDR